MSILDEIIKAKIRLHESNIIPDTLIIGKDGLDDIRNLMHTIPLSDEEFKSIKKIPENRFRLMELDGIYYEYLQGYLVFKSNTQFKYMMGLIYG